jgi:hypothetical protein
MKEIKIIPIEGHQVSQVDALVQLAERSGLIGALKSYSQAKLKKDRKIKVEREELDGEITYRASIVVGEVSLFDADFYCYQDVIDFKRKINVWVKSGAKTHKVQEVSA